MLDRVRAVILAVVLLRQPGRELLRGVVVIGQPLFHVQVRAHERGVVRVAERVMRDARLLDGEVLHCCRKRFLVAVAVGLEVVDELEVDPAGDPVPVQIMDDNVLLEDALIVAAPGEERHIVSAPGAKLRQRLRKAHAGGQPLAVKAGELFYLVVHALEVHGLDIDLKFFAGGHVLVELHRADLDDLATQVNGQLVEYGGFGTHRLIPFQIHHDIMHGSFPSFPVTLGV